MADAQTHRKARHLSPGRVIESKEKLKTPVHKGKTAQRKKKGTGNGEGVFWCEKSMKMLTIDEFPFQ